MSSVPNTIEFNKSTPMHVKYAVPQGSVLLFTLYMSMNYLLQHINKSATVVVAGYVYILMCANNLKIFKDSYKNNNKSLLSKIIYC